MLFVSGTDTGVGKTYFCTQLIHSLRVRHMDAVGFKPICCGDREDAEKIIHASDHSLSINECNPVWMRFPASPYTASIIEEKIIDLALIREQWEQLLNRFSRVIIEGVGGWSVPITRDYNMANLAVEFGCPVVVVAANRLGVLNHTLLTVEAIKTSGLKCAGIILNNLAGEDDHVAATNRSILDDLLAPQSISVLGEISKGDNLSDDLVSKIVRLFPKKKDLPPSVI